MLEEVLSKHSSWELSLSTFRTSSVLIFGEYVLTILLMTLGRHLCILMPFWNLDAVVFLYWRTPIYQQLLHCSAQSCVSRMSRSSCSLCFSSFVVDRVFYCFPFFFFTKCVQFYWTATRQSCKAVVKQYFNLWIIFSYYCNYWRFYWA